MNKRIIRGMVIVLAVFAAGTIGWYANHVVDYETRLRADAAIMASHCQPDNEVDAESDECQEHFELGVQ